MSIVLWAIMDVINVFQTVAKIIVGSAWMVRFDTAIVRDTCERSRFGHVWTRILDTLAHAKTRFLVTFGPAFLWTREATMLDTGGRDMGHVFMFGHVWTLFWTHLNTFGHICEFLDTYGHDHFGHVWTPWTRLDTPLIFP
jgi:hypothetical protein